MSLASARKDVLNDLLHFLRMEFSRYAYVSSIDEKNLKATIGLQVQEVIPDFKTSRTTIRVVPLDDVATVTWKKRGDRVRVVNFTRTDFVNRAKDEYLDTVQKSQTILLPTVYSKLVEVPHVMLAMSPLRKILMEIDDNGSIAPHELGRGSKVDSKIRRYFGLLEDLEFVKPENGHFVAGSKMRNLQASEIRPPDLFRTILGEVMRRKAKYLKEVLHWTMMVPYLQWCNTYYFPAYQAGHLVKTERDYLLKNYRRFYETRHLLTSEKDQIQQVVDAKLLEREGMFYEGTREVFDGYARGMDGANVLGAPTAYR